MRALVAAVVCVRGAGLMVVFSCCPRAAHLCSYTQQAISCQSCAIWPEGRGAPLCPHDGLAKHPPVMHARRPPPELCLARCVLGACIHWNQKQGLRKPDVGVVEVDQP